MIVWLTGLPSAGKSTIAEWLTSRFTQRGRGAVCVDADTVRRRLWPELGFSDADRCENVRRIGALACWLETCGVVAVVACIAPYREWRTQVRKQAREFVEVFVSCPLDVCRKRDVKGLYAQADSGQLRGLTGVDGVYEPPVDPEVLVQTDVESLNMCIQKIELALP